MSLYWVSQRIIMWIYFSFFLFFSGKAKTVKTFRMCALGQRLHEKLEAKTKLKGKKSKIAQEIRNDWRSFWNCAWFYYCLVCYKNLFIFLLFLILYFRCFLWFTCFAKGIVVGKVCTRFFSSFFNYIQVRLSVSHEYLHECLCYVERWWHTQKHYIPTILFSHNVSWNFIKS